MLLANVAWLLASAGCRVLLIDWDLEAPGLHRYFKPFLGEDPELRTQKGVLEWLTDYWDAYLDQPNTNIETLVRDFADPRHYVRKLETGTLVAGGIDLLCAGRQDACYAQAVADFDWTRLWQNLHGDEFIDTSKRILVGPGGYDYVLVDSRTGVSDTSGFCTVALADTLVVCFSYNNQSVIGASQIARDIKRQAERRREDQVREGQARRFRLFAVPSRVEDLDPERLERRQGHAWALFADLQTDVSPRQQPEYWVGVQVRNQALFAYEEVLAVCMNRPSDPQSVLGSVSQLTRWLTDDAFSEAPPLSDGQRTDLRERFADISGAAPRGPDREAWDLFTEQMPDPNGREAILNACFVLLVQLVSTEVNLMPSAQAANSATCFVRAMLLESDFTDDERRMAEILSSMYVTQRRITDGRQRGLMLRDESILKNWRGLHEKLAQNSDFIQAREQIYRARQSWEAGGRSLASLQGLHGKFLKVELTDEKRSWLGRRNLQFYELAQELRSWHGRERKLEGIAKFRAYSLILAGILTFVFAAGSLFLWWRNVHLQTANLTLSYRADVAKGWALIRNKRFPEAEVAFGRLIQLLPNDPSPLQGRAIALAQLKRAPEAASDLRQAIDLMAVNFETVDASNYYMLGRYYKDSNNIRDATTYFSKYLEIAKGPGASDFERLYVYDAEWELLYGLKSNTDLRQELSDAWKLNEYREFGEANLKFDKVLGISPESPSALLGRYYARDKLRRSDAASDMAQAMELMIKSGGSCDLEKRREGYAYSIPPAF
ncbi:MAG: ATP/GTP-binding protein [Gammaproteobacteria bacterium]|nr:ATP/GTP-binding protein [Gammaproteobacteria bacterium]